MPELSGNPEPTWIARILARRAIYKGPKSIVLQRIYSFCVPKLSETTFIWNDILTYRVIQNFASPSRAEKRQVSAKMTISSSNTFNLKWENQILDSETFYNCCKFDFFQKEVLYGNNRDFQYFKLPFFMFSIIVRQLDMMKS